MTARQVWESALTELSKVNAPSLLLHEFNYYFNKAINQYINKRYNIYDVNLQTTDDLRVLKATTILDPYKTVAYTDITEWGAGSSKLFGGTWEIILPSDYLHMLNCICIYEMLKTNKCYDKGNYVLFAAKRLTADSWSVILNDYYNRPLPERPYYYIHNVNSSSTVPTNPVHTVELSNGETTDPPKKTLSTQVGTDMSGTYEVTPSTDSVADTPEEVGANQEEGTNFNRIINISKDTTISTVEREIAQRYGNASAVRCEIRYGNDSSVYRLRKVLIDYIKAPLTIRLTKEQVDLTEDTSQIMEFPDYVCQEIINELVLLVMQRDADPRLQTQSIVTQSIANPVQQLTQQTQPQLRG